MRLCPLGWGVWVWVWEQESWIWGFSYTRQVEGLPCQQRAKEGQLGEGGVLGEGVGVPGEGVGVPGEGVGVLGEGAGLWEGAGERLGVESQLVRLCRIETGPALDWQVPQS